MKIMKTLLFLFVLVGLTQAADISTTKTGVWSDVTVWSTGTLPTAADNVFILDGHTITYDMDSAAVNNLTIGSETSAAGGWQISKLKQTKFTIYGNLVIFPNMVFKVQTVDPTVGKQIAHTLYMQGDITNNGSSFDLKNGSSTTLAVLNIVFFGSVNSTLTMNGGYTSTQNEFNGITLNKTGNAKVILATDVVCGSGSTSNTVACNPYFYFVNGVMVTGSHMLVHQSTTTAHMDTARTNSYILGNLARGMSNSGGKTCLFPVGDANGYRPITVMTSSSGVATGHYIAVGCYSGNANTGTSTFPDGLIDKVSELRYYKVTYGKLAVATTAPDTMVTTFFRPTYATGDGVTSGNEDLRVAYSLNERAAWYTFHDNYPDTTSVSATPKTISPDTLTTGFTLTNNVNAVYITLARLTGTTTNTLSATPNSVHGDVAKITKYQLEQNYPNPFNPTTKIRFSVPQTAHVVLKVYDVLGKEVAQLIDEVKSAGSYETEFKGAGLASGIYLYRLQTDNYQETKKMFLLK